MTISRAYFFASFVPTVVALVLVFAYSLYQNQGYTSEWLTREGAVQLDLVMTLLFCIILSLLALPVFLSRISSVRQNALAGFASWFLLPLGFMAWSLFGANANPDIIFYALIFIPFLVGLTYGYMKTAFK